MVSNGLNDDGVGLGVGGIPSAPGLRGSASCLDGTSFVCSGVDAATSGAACLFNTSAEICPSGPLLFSTNFKTLQFLEREREKKLC